MCTNEDLTRGARLLLTKVLLTLNTTVFGAIGCTWIYMHRMTTQLCSVLCFKIIFIGSLKKEKDVFPILYPGCHRQLCTDGLLQRPTQII